MRHFDDLTISTDDRRRVREVSLDFLRWTDQGDMTECLTLIATFRRSGTEIGQLLRATLDGHGAALDATELARFPWRRWLAVARLHAQAGTSLLPQGASDAWRVVVGAEAPDSDVGRRANTKTAAALRTAGVASVPAPRPGRGGHGPEFYEDVARRWLELVLAGDRAPARTIAHERNYSLNTVNGWIKRARELQPVPAMKNATKSAEEIK